MKLIFLDMDGVLNNNVFLSNIAEKLEMDNPQWWEMDNPQWWIEMIDPIAVSRLNTIVENTGANIVISSSWRMYNDFEMIQSYLDAAGFKGKVVDSTEVRFSYQPRGMEIKHFLEDTELKVDKFIILEDEADIRPFEKNTIIIDGKYGLLDKHVKKAIEMLND